MIKAERKWDVLFTVLVAVLVCAYVVGIFCVNFGGRAHNDFDIYSDAMLAKYMATEKTLFPEKWTFGNQIYVVATPVVAACVYPFVKDVYASMAIASCIMTLLTVASFLWCVKPLFGKKIALAGLLALIGGINVELTAHNEMDGLQIFYTMASYYACYVIGIFSTVGVYNRLFLKIPVNKVLLCVTVVLNFALGMQSLREMLVLNLPLCALAVWQWLLSALKKDTNYTVKKANLFVLAAFAANLLGVVASKLLAAEGVYAQRNILQETQPQWSNVLQAVDMFCYYIGLVFPDDFFTAFCYAVAVLSSLIVVVSLIKAMLECFQKKASVKTWNILFFAISLLAVFFAGVLVLSLRTIYYFCWYLMVPFCIMYLLDMEWKRPKLAVGLKRLLVVLLICISCVNYYFLFGKSYQELSADAEFYEGVVEQLRKDGIRYLYMDTFAEQPMIATMSHDDIVYAVLCFSGDPEQLWYKLPYLCHDDWYDPDNFEDSYILMTDITVERLERDFSEEYRTAFMENIQLVHTFAGNDTTVYLYEGTDKLYSDIS